eukprot:TRINITY_DN13505_c0_g1_i1.p4 TRINITY_DN13505_c0_g1~~TRINITY_DN13505_c0_g1_i1.p4  ORF type:complete len:56 (+),score=2.82 TRINITY_DN13505_c0_g1_i1:186-353(+)
MYGTALFLATWRSSRATTKKMCSTRAEPPRHEIQIPTRFPLNSQALVACMYPVGN